MYSFMSLKRSRDELSPSITTMFKMNTTGTVNIVEISNPSRELSFFDSRSIKPGDIMAVGIKKTDKTKSEIQKLMKLEK